jgi:hypothetical protein
MSILATYPGAIILIVLGIVVIKFNYKEFKQKREFRSNNDFFGVEIKGYVFGISLILFGLILLYTLIFTNTYD